MRSLLRLWKDVSLYLCLMTQRRKSHSFEGVVPTPSTLSHVLHLAQVPHLAILEVQDRRYCALLGQMCPLTHQLSEGVCSTPSQIWMLRDIRGKIKFVKKHLNLVVYTKTYAKR